MTDRTPTGLLWSSRCNSGPSEALAALSAAQELEEHLE